MLGTVLRRIFAARKVPDAQVELAELIESRVHDRVAGLIKGMPKLAPPFDYENIAYLLAAEDSARYMVEHMRLARNLAQREPLLEFALSACCIEGLVLEFGVYRGATLRFIAERAKQPVHGFDSFEGLPHDWTHFQRKGRFSLEGQAPQFDIDGIRLHPGLFSDSLPLFLRDHAGPVRFLHIDCDLYSSTKDVFFRLDSRIVPGTVIVFDEYLNYPGWREHEYKAFQEFIEMSGHNYRYLGFASTQCSVAVQIVSRGDLDGIHAG
jgi:hypothetical protein